MHLKNKNIYLIDLPTFPKGQITLAFPVIAASLPKRYAIKYIDLNIDDIQLNEFEFENCLFIGIKVSCQNLKNAIHLTNQLKLISENCKVIWGGELPTLLPDKALQYCDSIVTNAFEAIAEELVLDCEHHVLKKQYNGLLKTTKLITPDFSIIKHTESYSKLFGYPLETSKGCDKKCTFCMVHTMQPNAITKTKQQLINELNTLSGNFINVVDYNIGVSNAHLTNVIEAFTESTVTGWMAEMCIETLNDDELLDRLAKSKCKIIYCGLESIDENSLSSINKSKTNTIDNYKTIVQKAQKYGIQIAAGIIIGLPHATAKTLDATFDFFKQLGLIYVKLTFLTYNPGTKVHTSMQRVGEYTTDDITKFDGNHFTFLPHGVDKESILEALKYNIKDFYSQKSIELRANIALGNHNFQSLQWFKCFNEIYSDVYFNWLNYDIFTNENAINELLNLKYTKNNTTITAENNLLEAL